jgi:predicted small secreted protein
MIRVNSKIVSVLFACLVVAGCATSRGVLDIQVPDSPNSTSSRAVKITEVVDRRVFEIRPKAPSIPSLKNNEINDPSITLRAVARKRGG